MVSATPLQVLNSADEEELNYILCTVNCAMLVEVAKVETMDMLTAPEHRLHELTLMTRRAAARICSTRSTCRACRVKFVV